MIGSHIAEAAYLQQDDGVNYSYLPPAGWPPKDCDRPPVDDWMPPRYWEPYLNRLPLSPLGGLLLIPPPPGAESRPLSVEEQEEAHRRVVRRMLGMWARAVQADAHSYWQAAVRANWMDWAIDKWRSGRRMSKICRPHWSKSGCAATSSLCRHIRWNGGYRRIAGSTVSKPSRNGTKICGMPLSISMRPTSQS
jgi:hypothetical protein